jgi:hypothetical protein
MLPAMLAIRAVRRPYRSDRVPIMGEAMAWRRLHQRSALNCLLYPQNHPTHEKRLPRAPPSSTISYLESIGLEKDAL